MRIKSHMNRSVNPCDDFYEYGCGKWQQNNPIPPNRLLWSVDRRINIDTHYRIQLLLENVGVYDNLPPIQMVKQFYHSCLNENAIEKQGLKPLVSLLDKTGGWPIIIGKDKWNAKNITWQKVDNTYSKMFSESSFFNLDYLIDEENSARNILVINQDLQYSINKKNVNPLERYKPIKEYVDNVIKVVLAVAKYKGVIIPKKRLQADVADLILFIINLRNITEHHQENLQMKNSQTRMTITKLQKYYDQVKTQQPTAKINWLRMIQAFFEPVDITIIATQPVLVENKHLLHDLAHLLDITPSHIIVNYVQWNIIYQFLIYLNKEMREIAQSAAFSTDDANKSVRPRTCVANIAMQDAASYLFVKNYTSKETIYGAKKIFDDVKEVLKKRVLSSTWINKHMKRVIITKMNNIIPQIGYPEWYDDLDKFLKRYEGLEIGDNYFDNVVNTLNYDKNKYLAKFNQPPNRNEWIDYPITVNSFYSQTANIILIPAAELQKPYLSPKLPLAINYGVIGFLIGHELAHSFDSVGIQYNEYGRKMQCFNLENNAFTQKTRCFVNQYNNFTLDVTNEKGKFIQVNGHMTKDENIADSVGIEAAFDAFQNRKRKEEVTKLAHYTKITDEQLFFLSYVNAWCQSMDKSYELDIANTDEHSPPKFRIIGALANAPAFANAYNCPLNSKMNPKKKCNLWK